MWIKLKLYLECLALTVLPGKNRSILHISLQHCDRALYGNMTGKVSIPNFVSNDLDAETFAYVSKVGQSWDFMYLLTA